MRTTILADHIFDGERIQTGLRQLLVEGERIMRIAMLDAPPPEEPGVDTIDARGDLVMPGLVNAHAHVVRGGAFEEQEPPLPLQAATNFAHALAAGTTTIADLGCPPAMIRSFREATRGTSLAGPEVVAAGPVLTAPGGYPLDWMPKWVAKLGAAVACDGPRGGEAAVQRVADAGMDVVKLAVMHRSYADRPLRAMDVPTASAVVAEAHNLGLRVLAHAHSNADYRVAIAAGVDALMHSSFEPLDDELVAAVRDARIPVCPTLWVFESICALDDGEPAWSHLAPHVGRTVMRSLRRFTAAYRASTVIPPGIAGGLAKSRAREAVETAAANLRLLADAGVPIVFGNDAAYGFSLVARPVDELSAMQRAGLSAVACLRAATREASRVVGLIDRGRIAAGLRADLVGVPARAAEDVSALAEVRWVMKAGRRVPGSASVSPLLKAYGRGFGAMARDLLAGARLGGGDVR